MPLTDLKIRSLAPGDKVYSRADEHGLMLEVHPNGSMLWRFKFRHLGKQKRVALGRYPIIGLAEARKRRDEERRKLESGVDWPAAGLTVPLSCTPILDHPAGDFPAC